MAGDPMMPLLSSFGLSMGPPTPAGVRAIGDVAKMFAPKPVVAKLPGPDIKAIVPKSALPVVMNPIQVFQPEGRIPAQINIDIPNQTTGQGSSSLLKAVQDSMLVMMQGPPMIGSMPAMQQGPPMLGQVSSAGFLALAQGASGATIEDPMELMGTGSPVGIAKRDPCASKTYKQTVTSSKWYPVVRPITHLERTEDRASILVGGSRENANRLKELTASIADLALSELKDEFDYLAAQGDCMSDGCAAEEEWCDVASYNLMTFAWLRSAAAPPPGASIGRTLKIGDPDVAGWRQAQAVFEITCSCQA